MTHPLVNDQLYPPLRHKSQDQGQKANLSEEISEKQTNNRIIN